MEGGPSLALGPLRAAETPQGRARDWSEGEKNKHGVEHRLRLDQGRAGSPLSVPAGDKLVLSRTGLLGEARHYGGAELQPVEAALGGGVLFCHGSAPLPQTTGCPLPAAPTRLPVSLRKERTSGSPWSRGRA